MTDALKCKQYSIAVAGQVELILTFSLHFIMLGSLIYNCALNIIKWLYFLFLKSETAKYLA